MSYPHVKQNKTHHSWGRQRKQESRVKPGTFPAWEFNTIPSSDREWMARNQSDLDRAALSLSITGGSDNDNEEG